MFCHSLAAILQRFHFTRINAESGRQSPAALFSALSVTALLHPSGKGVAEQTGINFSLSVEDGPSNVAASFYLAGLLPVVRGNSADRVVRAEDLQRINKRAASCVSAVPCRENIRDARRWSRCCLVLCAEDEASNVEWGERRSEIRRAEVHRAEFIPCP